MIIEVGGSEWRRIEDYMNEHGDCIDKMSLYEVIMFYARIYRIYSPIWRDDLTCDEVADKAVAIAAAQLYCDIPADF